MQFRRVKKPSVAMDMSPLLDCVLQLLIFFMLSSTFMSPRISIALPQAGASDGPTRSDSVIVTAAADGRLFVNTEPVAPDRLEAALRPRLARSPTKTVVFRGDEAVAYRTVMHVIDRARRAGAEHLDIAHRSPSEKRGADDRNDGNDGGAAAGEGPTDGR